MNNTHNLMKHFASMLRKKALGKENDSGVNPDLLRYLTRKELVEILLAKHNGSIPKELHLVEMENEQLLTLIGDELLILAYLAPKWCEEKVSIPEKPAIQKNVSKENKEAAKPSKKS